ncbi:MAG: biotin/lipoyl-binding protein, partial [Bacteroidales bacterium]|nr:biotin/lipoyl-binding protein [Bacteroidales bacterium]
MVLKRHEIRESSPVEEIIGKTPSSIVRWGVSIVAIVFLIAIAGSWFIRYPYIIPGTIRITTALPPASIMAQVSGRIEQFNVTEGQKVQAEEILGFLESSANLESVLQLYNIISRDSVDLEQNRLWEESTVLPESRLLGELQTDYSKFRAAFVNYIDHIEVDYYGKKIEALSAEIAGIEQLISQLGRKENLLKEKVALATAEFNRDSLVFADEYISVQDIEDSRKSLLVDEIALQEVGVDISLKKVDMLSKLRDLEDFKAAREGDRRNAYSLVEKERLSLSGELETWFRLHLLKSPISGKVTFSRYWGENQTVNQGDIVMTVIPQGKQRIIGRSEITMRGAGRVTPGRQVIIKLDAYP